MSPLKRKKLSKIRYELDKLDNSLIKLIKKMANKHNLSYLNMYTVLKDHPVIFGEKTLIHFPSYAVANLLREKYE